MTSEELQRCHRAIQHMENHISEMDAHVRMKRVDIQNLTAAADQLEKDKIELSIAVERMKAIMDGGGTYP